MDRSMGGFSIPLDVNVAHETPKYWKEYLKHIYGQYDKELRQHERNLDELEKKYAGYSFWEKLWRGDGSLEIEHFDIMGHPTFPEPSLTDYYTWDVNVRQKEQKS